MLQEKYAPLADAAKKLGIRNFAVKEEGGKLIIKGLAEYGIDRDHIWDAIKKQAGWEKEIVADIKVEKTDIYGHWTVKSGDSLSKIAKDVYDDGKKYMKIYEANKATIGDSPDRIKPGQKLQLPNP